MDQNWDLVVKPELWNLKQCHFHEMVHTIELHIGAEADAQPAITSARISIFS